MTGGRMEPLLRRMYARFGANVLLISFAALVVIGMPAALVIAEFEARFLGWTTAEVWGLLALWVPILFVIGIGGLFIWPEPWRTVLRWNGPRAASAEATWGALTGLRRGALRTIGTVLAAIPVATLYEVLHFHERWYAFGILTGVDAVCMTAWTLLGVAVMELMLRPMLEEVAERLPEDFDPNRRAMSVRTKLLLSLPVVTIFAGLLVGAYANAASDGSARFALAAGLALLTATVATVIQVIINRALLAPVDELLEATRRVRGGDLRRPVPVISDDELGALAHSFNQMQAGLRQRESLRSELEASRARIVAAADAERRRMERDLHDGAQQHLVLVNLKLGLLARAIESDPIAALAMVEELRGDLARAQTALRDLAHGIYPQALENDGLREALAQVAERAPLPTEVECDAIGRYGPEIEAAVYFCCLEALQNAAKHAGDGATARVRLQDGNGILRFAVSDDGRGFDRNGSGAGLQNMTDRIGALGGTLDVRSAPGAGTTVAGAIPV